MRFSLRDSVCLASGDHNEDRIGHITDSVWVIDGATDVLKRRILPGPSDAAWYADALNRALAHAAEDRAHTLVDLVEVVTVELAQKFENAAVRPVKFDHERPSAAGIVARVSSGTLEAVSLGDCSLIALGQNTAQTRDLFRQDMARDADALVRQAVRDLRDNNKTTAPDPGQAEQSLHDELLPMLRALRDRLNKEPGYGIFSIIPPQRHQIQHVTQSVRTGDRFLLASDGFMRLVDIFEAHTLQSLADSIAERGLASLAVELRKIERADADGTSHPRSKAHDDASALIVEVIG